jgi:sporulation protein YabP
MENAKNIKPQYNHILHIENRQKLGITGVNHVVTFNENMVVLRTTMGVLNIKGKNIKINKLNVDNGDMSIEGELTSFIYSSKDLNTGKKGNFIDKLLK